MIILEINHEFEYYVAIVDITNFNPHFIFLIRMKQQEIGTVTQIP